MESNNCAENTEESMEVVDKLGAEHSFEYNVEKINEEVTKSMDLPCDKLETNESDGMEVELGNNQEIASIADNLSSDKNEVTNDLSSHNEEPATNSSNQEALGEHEVNTNGDVDMQSSELIEQNKVDTSEISNNVESNTAETTEVMDVEQDIDKLIDSTQENTDTVRDILENSNQGDENETQEVQDEESSESTTNGNDTGDKPVTETMETQTIVDEEEEEEKEEAIELPQLEEIDVNICKTVSEHTCFVCKKNKVVKYSFTKKDLDDANNEEFVCTDPCYELLKAHCTQVNSPSYFDKVLHITEDSNIKFIRKCAQCRKIIKSETGCCSWEAMDFCREHCLYRYQQRNKKQCAECANPVEYNQLGKYSVRFGCIIRQFCSGICLDMRKKKTRICSYCQLAMPTVGIAVGQKFFCTTLCKDKHAQLTAPNKPPYIPANKVNSTFCYLCNDDSKPVIIEFGLPGTSYYFCGEECLIIFKFLHNFNSNMNKCHNCEKYSTMNQLITFGMYYDGSFNYFCSKTCQHIHIITHRRIIPCVWCKVKKYNFDMIYKEGLMEQTVFACSLNCLNHLKSALDHVTAKGKYCAQCPDEPAVCDITTADGSTKSFCSNKCIADFQSKLRKLETKGDKTAQLPLITSVCSLADSQNEKRIMFIVEEDEPEVANKMCSVRPMTVDQETQIYKEKADMEAQTDFKEELKLRAVPVPIYIPQPLNVWNCPVPRAVPFPLVVPLPILIPLTRDSSTEYLKTMKKEPVKTPRDPYEAELLMMAELVAAEKPKEEIEDPDEGTEDFSPEPVDTGFHDDMLQIALKMATDYQDASAVDLEGSLQASTITPGQHAMGEQLTRPDEIIHTEPLTGMRGVGATRGRGRGRGSRGPRGGTSSRRGRGRTPVLPVVAIPEPTPPPPPEPVEKPDANMCLKYTFGVNAWKQWVTIKNADLERSSRKLKLFKNDLLQMTADELNYSLCLFVNEVRKPNGSEYAPDTIYYLCLGIQQYLYECGRIDNIFCDSFYEKFTDCLDGVCSKFSSLYNDSHYIVTRVEEEHLWESKQLGAHSPYVLLTTLMFFNTKHFNLTSVEEHMQLSFSHIMKHWKRNPGQGGSRGGGHGPGGRNVLLRFYPPQNAQANSRKKKVYEQQENEENPLRCPVKLYEFYLSKCPESVKTRNDVFYLMPERSCVPESPVWYSTMALDVRALKKMLHRVKMVKEINVALLTH